MTGRDYNLRGRQVFDGNDKLVATISETGNFKTSDGAYGNYDSRTGKVYIKGLLIGKTKLKS